MPYDPFQFFQMGQQMAGKSALSQSLEGVLDTAKQLGLAKAKSQFEHEGDMATMREKARIETESPFGQYWTAAAKSLSGGEAPITPEAGATPTSPAGGFIPTRLSKGGITLENPQAKAAMEQAKLNVKLSPERNILKNNLVRMKDLSDKIPSPEVGWKRPFQAMGTRLKGFTQELPELNTYNRFRDVILGSVVKIIGGETGSRLSDQDINRMRGAFPNPAADTKEQQQLQWKTFAETVNDVVSQYGGTPVDLSDIAGELGGTLPPTVGQRTPSSGSRRRIHLNEQGIPVGGEVIP